jgi:hypothetical protein
MLEILGIKIVFIIFSEIQSICNNTNTLVNHSVKSAQVQNFDIQTAGPSLGVICMLVRWIWKSLYAFVRHALIKPRLAK